MLRCLIVLSFVCNAVSVESGHHVRTLFSEGKHGEILRYVAGLREAQPILESIQVLGDLDPVGYRNVFIAQLENSDVKIRRLALSGLRKAMAMERDRRNKDGSKQVERNKYTTKEVELNTAIMEFMTTGEKRDAQKGTLLHLGNEYQTKSVGLSEATINVEYTFKNKSKTAVSVDVKTGCGCIQSSSMKHSYGPDEQGTMVLSFNLPKSKLNLQKTTTIVARSSDGVVEKYRVVTSIVRE